MLTKTLIPFFWQAHHHPYIEQLGVIYLMKLRYKKHFGKRAGTCWRMIFIYALMPWLHGYRILARDDDLPDTTTGKGDDDNVEADPSLQFVSVRNVNAAGDGLSRRHTEVMWKFKAAVMKEGLDCSV